MTPRQASGRRHKLIDIIAIAICVTICGADNWVAITAFGRAKEGWLRSFLTLAYGIPSHDTFRRVFALLDAEQFQESFMAWVEAIVQVLPGQVIAIDGKTARAAHDGQDASTATHMVTAWATANGVALGQVAVADKSNEITAIPDLLYQLQLQGCLVTLDAMGCQKEIATQIVAQDRVSPRSMRNPEISRSYLWKLLLKIPCSLSENQLYLTESLQRQQQYYFRILHEIGRHPVMAHRGIDRTRTTFNKKNCEIAWWPIIFRLFHSSGS